MQSVKTFFGQRRMMILVTLTVLVLAAAALIASSASFTATSANPGNMFTAGTLTMSNSKADTAVLTASLMVPGDKQSGSVVITNTGDVAGHFSLVVAKSGELKKLAGKLELTISDGTSTWTGTVDGLVGSIDLGKIGAGDSKTYSVTAVFPDTGVDGSGVGNENAYMGGAVTVGFTFNATNL